MPHGRRDRIQNKQLANRWDRLTGFQCFNNMLHETQMKHMESFLSSLTLAPASISAQARPGIAVVSISRLQALCEALAPRYLDHARIFPVREGYGAAVKALQSHIDAGTVDVVLAAGSNGAYLREHLSVPVVMVKVNGFDVLRAISEATTMRPNARIGLILHDSISAELDGLRSWLNIEVIQRAYRSLDEVRRVVQELVAEGCEAIIGPGMACDFAERAGVESVFLYSLGAVDEAFERSVELARVSREKESKRLRLNTIVAHLRDGVAAFDDLGQLEAVNPAMLELLGLKRERDVSAQLAAKVGSLLREAAGRDTPIEERIEHFDGRALSVNCMPMTEHGVRTGMVVTAQDALVAQRIDRSLRTSQRPTYLVARHRLGDLIGSSPAMQKVRRLALTGAAHEATVLLTGESGTGKELVVQGIHTASKRRGNPFVAFNCAALPEGLIESELFGHEEGAFTGARRGGKQGLFELAHTGTIFLDEIGEMPAALQSRLLRVLQERQVMKLGSGQATPVDVRVIAATHRDLKALVASGAFRADLYFRLNVLHIALPALRERRSDLPEIARHLLEGIVAEYDLPRDRMPGVLHLLAPLFMRYPWPGNVRELANLLTRAAVHFDELQRGSHDDLLDVFPELKEPDDRPDALPVAPLTLDEVRHVLDECGGNRSAAAKRLGISRTTLWRLTKDA
jgi:transcriptional regulator, propionate catabolism operon regulatory protein